MPVVSPNRPTDTATSPGKSLFQGKTTKWRAVLNATMKETGAPRNTHTKGDKFMVYTSSPVSVENDGTARFALIFHGHNDTQRGKESYHIKCSAVRRAFILAKMCDPDTFGKHKYMNQVLNSVHVAALRKTPGIVEKDDPFCTDKDGHWPHKVLYGIITIQKEDIEAIDSEIASVVACLKQVIRSNNYFKYYHHGLYWELIESNKDNNEIIEHFAEIEEGPHDFLEYLNKQLEKNALGKSVMMKKTYMNNGLSFDTEACLPDFFKKRHPKANKHTSYSAPILHRKDAPLIDVVVNSDVDAIGMQLYGKYTKAVKEIIFGICDDIASKDDSFLST